MNLLYSLGFGPVIFALCGELFTTESKGFGCSLALTVRYPRLSETQGILINHAHFPLQSRYLSVFVNLKLFTLGYEMVGIHGIFFFYCGVSLLAIGTVWAFLPETRNVTAAEIGSYFANEPRRGYVPIQNNS